LDCRVTTNSSIDIYKTLITCNPMKLKKLSLKVRVNKSNGQLNVNLPRKKFSLKELDNLTSGKVIKLLMEQNDK